MRSNTSLPFDGIGPLVFFLLNPPPIENRRKSFSVTFPACETMALFHVFLDPHLLALFPSLIGIVRTHARGPLPDSHSRKSHPKNLYLLCGEYPPISPLCPRISVGARFDRVECCAVSFVLHREEILCPGSSRSIKAVLHLRTELFSLSRTGLEGPLLSFPFFTDSSLPPHSLEIIPALYRLSSGAFLVFWNIGTSYLVVLISIPPLFFSFHLCDFLRYLIICAPHVLVGGNTACTVVRDP